MEKTLSNNDQSMNTPGSYRITFKKIRRAVSAELLVHKKMYIISLVLYGLAFLLFAVNSESYIRPQFPEEVDYEKIITGFKPSVWAAIFAIVGCFSGFFAVFNVFRDINNQQMCDVSMSLPIKASERYISKILALIVMQVVPMLICTFGGMGLNILFARLGSVEVEKKVFDIYITTAFALLAALMFIISVAVISACCCGAAAESVYFSIIVAGIANILPVGIAYNMAPLCSGINGGEPFSMIMGGMGTVDVNWWGFLFVEKLIAGDFGASVVLHCAVGIAISLLVTALAGFIFVKRDATTVGVPIANRVFFEAIMFLGCFSVYSVFSLRDSLVWGLIISAAIYIIINIVVSRAKLKVLIIGKWFLKFIATTAAFTVLLTVCVKTGGFGEAYIRPDTEYFEDADFFISLHQYGKTKVFSADKLTAEQGENLLNICRKHIKDGFSKTNIWDKACGNIRNDPASHGCGTVMVGITGNKRYETRPSPHSIFHMDYMNGKTYFLDMIQEIAIPTECIDELFEELKAIDYVSSSAYNLA